MVPALWPNDGIQWRYYTGRIITRAPKKEEDVIVRSLGSVGPSVSALGLGCMGMSAAYGSADYSDSLRTIHAALDAGITLFDTGDFYGMGHNEILLHEALRGRDRERVLLSVKFGALSDPVGGFSGVDVRPAAMKNFLAYSLRRLGTDYIDVYRPARVDPAVPIEEAVGAIAEMVQAGYVRYIGLSEAGSETLRLAHAVHPIVDVQIEYSLLSRGVEAEIMPACRELGVGVTAFGVLSHGLLSGHWSGERALAPDDLRSYAPRFGQVNLKHNLSLVETLREVADEKGVTVAQLAIGWVLSRDRHIVALVGARRPDALAEALGALDLDLTEDDLRQIESAIPLGAAAGERYDAGQMASLDSERRVGSS